MYKIQHCTNLKTCTQCIQYVKFQKMSCQTFFLTRYKKTHFTNLNTCTQCMYIGKCMKFVPMYDVHKCTIYIIQIKEARASNK